MILRIATCEVLLFKFSPDDAKFKMLDELKIMTHLNYHLVYEILLSKKHKDLIIFLPFPIMIEVNYSGGSTLTASMPY